jgi:hypothetical protein
MFFGAPCVCVGPKGGGLLTTEEFAKLDTYLMFRVPYFGWIEYLFDRLPNT